MTAAERVRRFKPDTPPGIVADALRDAGLDADADLMAACGCWLRRTKAKRAERYAVFRFGRGLVAHLTLKQWGGRPGWLAEFAWDRRREHFPDGTLHEVAMTVDHVERVDLANDEVWAYLEARFGRGEE